VNGRPSYNPRSDTLPGVEERKTPLKLVVSNDAPKGKSK
jgi:hypothetical protein